MTSPSDLTSIGPVGPITDPVGPVGPYVARGPVGSYGMVSPCDSDHLVADGPMGPYAARGPVGSYGMPYRVTLFSKLLMARWARMIHVARWARMGFHPM